MTRHVIRIVGFICALMWIPAFSRAQATGSLKAVATVLPTISVTGTHDLNFETVMPGVDKSVDKLSVGQAGEFQIHGTILAEVTLDFTLPDSLALGTAILPISFSSTDASYDDGTAGGQQSPAGTINPNIQNALRLGADGYMFVWLGGTVNPTLLQNSGDYEAEVTLTVTYTGN
jgi:hypothetical protein